MNIRTFDLERIQSLYENTVPYNLTESGFHPYTLSELLSDEQLADLHGEVLGYGQTNGSVALRNRIAELYPGLKADNILVCNGSSEANFIACHSLLSRGDEVLIMLPNYMQIWGVVEEIGAVPRAFHLLEDKNWAPDMDELRASMSSKTRMIAICNPNNPTGYILSMAEMEEIVAIAREFGAWIYCDEVYRGAELSGSEAASFIGMYDRVLVTGGLSKAYALPGLRLGWLAGDSNTISELWSYHDYTSITSGILSQKIAEFALEKSMRQKILSRNRELLKSNLDTVRDWLKQWEDHFFFIEPKGGGMAFMRYDMDINSSKLSERLRKEFGLFVAAGDWFGMDNYIRIGIGAEREYLQQGMSIFTKGIKHICQL